MSLAAGLSRRSGGGKGVTRWSPRAEHNGHRQRPSSHLANLGPLVAKVSCSHLWVLIILSAMWKVRSDGVPSKNHVARGLRRHRRHPAYPWLNRLPPAFLWREAVARSETAAGHSRGGPLPSDLVRVATLDGVETSRCCAASPFKFMLRWLGSSGRRSRLAR